MRTIFRRAAVPAAALVLVVLPGAAEAKGGTPPKPTTTAPAPPAPVPGQAAGKIQLVLQKVGGTPRFAIAGIDQRDPAGAIGQGAGGHVKR